MHKVALIRQDTDECLCTFPVPEEASEFYILIKYANMLGLDSPEQISEKSTISKDIISIYQERHELSAVTGYLSYPIGNSDCHAIIVDGEIIMFYIYTDGRIEGPKRRDSIVRAVVASEFLPIPKIPAQIVKILKEMGI